VNARRILPGLAATAAVLAVCYQPLDFTMAQADAVWPASDPGALPVVEVAPEPSPPESGGSPWTVDNYRQASDPGCHEDEAAVVAHDPDPSHGLTWICVSLEELRR
jgi:hypothetical protein